MWQPNTSLVQLRPVDEHDVDDILSWVNDKSVVGKTVAKSDAEMDTVRILGIRAELRQTVTARGEVKLIRFAD